MDKLKKVGVRPKRAKRLDHPNRYLAAAVHREASRLVDNEQMLIFVQYARAQPPIVRGYRRRWRRSPYGRQTHAVPLLHAVVGSGATAIHAYLAAAQQSIHPALRHTF